MKKAFLPLLAGFVALAASAAIPTTFNYQGVCKEANQAIDVKFQIVGPNDYMVYQETHEGVETTASGAFTVVVGEGVSTSEHAWEDIDWVGDGLTIITFINDEEVSRAPFHAVPYALVAQEVIGVGNVQEVLDNVTSDVQGLVESMRGKANVEDVVANTEAIEIVSSDLQGVVESLRGKANVEDVVANTEAIEIVSSDLQGVVESLRGKANVEDVVALQEGLSVVEDDLRGIVEELPTVKSDIADIQARLDSEGVLSDKELAALQLGFKALSNEFDVLLNAFEANNQAVDNMQEAVNNATSDVQGLTEAMRGKANVEDVVALQEGLSVVEDDLRDVVEALPTIKSDIADMQTWQANVGENLEMLIPVIETLLESADTQEEAIANVTSDVQGLVESMRGKANVEDVVALQEGLSVVEDDLRGIVEDFPAVKNDVNEIKAALANIDENTTMANDVINTLLEDVETLQTGLGEAEQTLIELTEDNMSNKAAIADMQVWQANVGENLDMLTPVIEMLLEKADATDEVVDEVAALQSTVQNQAQVIAALSSRVANLEAAIAK